MSSQYLTRLGSYAPIRNTQPIYEDEGVAISRTRRILQRRQASAGSTNDNTHKVLYHDEAR